MVDNITMNGDTNRKTLNILLAEDSSDNRFLINAFLKDFNCRLTMVVNGQEAFDTFKTEEYDIVLMDMQMPIMDGFTATEYIREWEEQNKLLQTPILALTAYSESEEIEQCIRAGCNGYIAKPVRKKTLLNVVMEFTGQK